MSGMTLTSGQVLAARYALLRRLGDGRTAEVWLARDREDRVDRVLKILRPQLLAADAERERFLHAADLQRGIDHPNVLRCTELHDGEVVFAVFANDAIADLSRQRGAAAQRLIPLLDRVAAGLAAVHAHGLVHRDLKSANVLLTDDGRPMLTDFGLAARVGDESAASGSSPFTSSPQQLAGCAPQVTDDIYSFGAMTYELLSGYPPFYPDADVALAATAPPALPVVRGAMPPQLDGLVRRCLARQPEQRPQSAVEVRDLLQSMTVAAPEPVAIRDEVSRATLRAPDPPPVAIEPQWRKPAASGPSPGELRSQGFRRGLLAAALSLLLVAAGMVFFVLPQWVERNDAAVVAPAPPAAVKPAPAAPAAPVRDLQQLAELKRQFDELRPVVAGRLAGLEQRSAGSWAGAQFARGKQRLAAADVASGSREYSVALTRLREADADLKAVEQRVDATLRAALAAGLAAVETGDAVAARREFDTALAIDASNAAARRGLRRLDTLDEVRRLLAEAAEQERSGQTDAAKATYRKALALDPDTGAARNALARLDAQAAGNAFGAAVADALAAMSRKDYAAAREAFERAGRIRPAAPEVREGLEQIERAIGDRSIGSHLEAAQKAEREERWGEALVEYRKALKIDANLLAAQQGVERAEPRAMLDAELTSYLQRPERVFSSDMRGAARATIAQASAVQNPGPVLSGQISELRSLVTAAETPIRLAIASDNQTEVVIYRVGKLGAFERKDMELLPGRYTVVGTRAGFRDVRREVTIMPGREPPAVVIRCEEQI
jgi:tetratricopeptide (TPR) repeat protein